METVELQVTLKGYDPSKDKRFNGTVKLPNIPRPQMKGCMLGDAAHCDEAAALGMQFKSVENLKAFNKNKKVIKKFGF